MKEHTLKVETTAHYYTLGELNENTNEIWLVCHGYGQLAKFFLQKFNSLHKEGVLIIAPEGFNKFYLKGFSGRVGASWMTKEKREDEIFDHCNFLEKITSELKEQANVNCKINILGFSQGTATVSRWALKTNITINSLILWGGKIANEFHFKSYNLKHSNTKNFVVFGTKDEFYPIDYVKEYKFQMDGLKAEWISYTGGHTIDEATLKLINSKID